MLDHLIHIDQQLLLALNGSDSMWLDNVMLSITRTGTWVPLILVLLIILLKNRPWREVLLFVVFLALVIFLCDRFSSGFCKPYFHRFRPSHEPLLEGLVDLVDDRRGGLYGFISSHAANTFGAWAFISLYFRRRPMTWTILLWACLCSYSRIYLGFHYPGDILCGALWGVLSGAFCYAMMRLYARWRGLLLYGQGQPACTLFGRLSNPDGFKPRDILFFAASFAITLFLVALYAFL
ncbi:MAG: phosphatase PAP2 family protein [Bacteroidaceae bacterium]|nr:phosphatase PAP2 family protein [Bacteroidaceae bacterium]